MKKSPHLKALYTPFYLAPIFAFVAYAAEAQLEPTWGAATNGVRLGSAIYLKDSFGKEQPPECIIYLKNFGTNKMVLWFPPVEHRYQLELRDPNNLEIELVKEKLEEATHSSRHPVALPTNEVGCAQIGKFYITDILKVKTNGLYTLILSERAATNYIRGKELTCFLFPPVTNKFNISPEQIKK